MSRILHWFSSQHRGIRSPVHMPSAAKKLGRFGFGFLPLMVPKAPRVFLALSSPTYFGQTLSTGSIFSSQRGSLARMRAVSCLVRGCSDCAARPLLPTTPPKEKGEKKKKLQLGFPAHRQHCAGWMREGGRGIRIATSLLRMSIYARPSSHAPPSGLISSWQLLNSSFRPKPCRGGKAQLWAADIIRVAGTSSVGEWIGHVSETQTQFFPFLCTASWFISASLVRDLCVLVPRFIPWLVFRGHMFPAAVAHRDVYCPNTPPPSPPLHHVLICHQPPLRPLLFYFPKVVKVLNRFLPPPPF